jgi:membrane protease YdiL (CAAX protease family)
LEKQKNQFSVLGSQFPVEGESLSSSDNPEFEPHPVVSVEPTVSLPLAPDPFTPDAVTGAQIPSAPIPIENPVWSGWDVLLIAGLTILSMIVLQILVVVGALWLVYPHSNFAAVAQKPILLLVSQFLIYAAVAACMVMLVEGKYHVKFWQAIRWNWPRSGWKLLALGAGMLIVLGLLQSVLPMPKDTPFEHLFDRPRDAYLLAIIAVSLGPLMEELFFRGFMYPVLARRMGAGWAIALTALPFGLIHLPQYGWAWGAALIVVLVGVVCGVVRAQTRSVGASFLVHVGYNGTQMILALVYTHGFQHMEKAVASLTSP